MKKGISVSIIVIGAILFIVGLYTQIPGRQLTTYKSLAGETYSVVEEYVGGDAYNYIIAASLTGGEIAGAKVQKAVFISVGLLIICLGLCSLSKKDTTLPRTIENKNTFDTDVDVDEVTTDGVDGGAIES